MTRLFISYSRNDEDFARALAEALSDLGVDIWIDVDDIPAGMKWSSAIQEGLDSCEALIIIISPSSMASTNVEDEWQYYLDQGKPLIPVLWKPAKIHFQINRLQYINFDDQPFEAAFSKLHAEILRQGLQLDPLPEKAEDSQPVPEGPSQTNALSSPPLAQPPPAAEEAERDHSPMREPPTLAQPVNEPSPPRQRQHEGNTGSRLSRLNLRAGGFALVIVVMLQVLFGNDLAAIFAPANEFAITPVSEAGVTPMPASSSDTPQPLTEIALAYTDEAQTAVVHATETAASWTATPTPDATETFEAYETILAPTMRTFTPTATSTPTLTPTPPPTFIPPDAANTAWEPSIERSVFEQMQMVVVPGGCFNMGRDPVYEGVPVCLDSFWIGEMEVTNDQYRACVEASSCTSPKDTGFYDSPDYQDYPVVFVSWTQASEYVAWLSAETDLDVRLPTEAQWEYAMRGPQSWFYPWGNTFDGTRLNFCDASCDRTAIADINVNDSYADAAPANSFREQDESWVGAINMAGNVREWVADWYSSDATFNLSQMDAGGLPGVLNPTGTASGTQRVMRGASWYNSASYARSYVREAFSPDSVDDHWGFRVVVVPDAEQAERTTETTP